MILYACENDHGAVARLKEDLKNKLLLLPCMVDRICASRHIFSDKVRAAAAAVAAAVTAASAAATTIAAAAAA